MTKEEVNAIRARCEAERDVLARFIALRTNLITDHEKSSSKYWLAWARQQTQGGIK